MQFDPRAIALGLSFAQADRAVHLVLAYTLELKSVAEAAVMGAFGALSLWNFRPWRVADHQARDFFGAAASAWSGVRSMNLKTALEMRSEWPTASNENGCKH
jgi:hypothetical protein